MTVPIAGLHTASPSASREQLLQQAETWPDEVRRTRADALRDAIAEAIVRGELGPGQRLDEVSVAQRFAVSRTPVREALKQLATMDLVELRPHRGAVVAGLDATRLAELFEAMEEVEAVCARLAAVKMSRRRPGAARRSPSPDCDAVLRAAAELELVHAANMEFHTAIHHGRAQRLPGRGRLGAAAQAGAAVACPVRAERPDRQFGGRAPRAVRRDQQPRWRPPPSRRCAATSASVAVAFDRWLEHGRERRRS